MSLFQKRHYIAIARVLYDCRFSAPASDMQREVIVREFVTLFSRDNDRFEPERFRLACETGEALGAGVYGGPAMQYGTSGKYDDVAFRKRRAGK